MRIQLTVGESTTLPCKEFRITKLNISARGEVGLAEDSEFEGWGVRIRYFVYDVLKLNISARGEVGLAADSEFEGRGMRIRYFVYDVLKFNISARGEAGYRSRFRF